MHKKLWLNWVAIVAILALLALIWQQCRPDQPAQTGAQPWRPECPHDSIAIVVADKEQPSGTKTITDIPLASTIDHIAEFHDCQRFIVKDDNTGQERFGPMVAIFASEDLATLEESLDSLLERPAARDSALAGAEIYNYHEAYDPLFIEHGFNCLFLRKENARDWVARMVPVGNQADACLGFQDVNALGHPLDVRPVAQGPYGGQDIPRVARWDWDGTQQYIGIKCGDQWCEIGPQGGFATSSRSWANDVLNQPGAANLQEFAPTTPNDPANRVVEVKGWFDEQRLAVPSGGGGMLPASRPALAIPHPRLGLYDIPYFEQHDWLPSALVVLPPGLDGYITKRNWAAGVNRVYLCSGSPEECKIPSAEAPMCQPEWASNDNREWWAKTVSSSEDVKYQCVTRCEQNLEIPGTVRWRWEEQDEKLWIRCATGCCAVN